MASSLALRKVARSSILSKVLNPFRSAPVALSRAFNTNAQMATRGDEEDYDRSVEDYRRRGVSRRGDTVPGFFGDVFDPFSTTKSLSQLMNVMDQMMDNPFLSTTRGMSGGARRGWDVKEDENALHLRVDMPGLSKENVKISVEQNTLVIRGEEASETEEEGARRYSSRLDLPIELFKVDEIKAEMKNGVLKVVVPKVKEEERKDVIQVNVE